MKSHNLHFLLFCLPVASFLGGLFLGACGPTAAVCPVVVTQSSCPALTGADLEARCQDVALGSQPVLFRRSGQVPAGCGFPIEGAVLVDRVQCGDGNEIELWCAK